MFENMEVTFVGVEDKHHHYLEVETTCFSTLNFCLSEHVLYENIDNNNSKWVELLTPKISHFLNSTTQLSLHKIVSVCFVITIGRYEIDEN